MPFTPLHMGPGLLIKALLQGGFSLMIFGWAQIVMDLQPLWVIVTGSGELHGFSHTYLGATLLGFLAALSGKYLAPFGLKVLRVSLPTGVHFRWPIVFTSAYIGSYSHVAIDSVMHADMSPLSPFNETNPLLRLISIDTLHLLCLLTGALGTAIYLATAYRQKVDQTKPN